MTNLPDEQGNSGDLDPKLDPKRKYTLAIISDIIAKFNKKSTPKTIKLSGDAAALLEHIAEAEGITEEEAVRRAITDAAFFLTERREGTTILLMNMKRKKQEEQVREVRWKSKR